MLRRIARTLAFLLVALMSAAPASAQIVQSFQFGAGAFLPRGYDSRAEGDVLVTDLTGTAYGGFQDSLAFKISDFRSGQVSGEWLVAFGPHIEASVGVGYYRGGTHSIYRDLVNSARGYSDIEQDLKLRIVPVTGLVRFLPFGRPGSFQPYVGVGVSALRWRYSEIGDFVDPSDCGRPQGCTIFADRYVASGTAAGPVVVGGIRMPIKGDIYGVTAEWRYQGGTGKLPADKGFLSDRIDLSGNHVNFAFLVRF